MTPLLFGAGAVLALVVLSALLRRPALLALLVVGGAVAIAAVTRDPGHPAPPEAAGGAEGAVATALASAGEGETQPAAPTMPSISAASAAPAPQIAVAPRVAPAAPAAPAVPSAPVASAFVNRGARQTLPFNGPRAEGLGDQCTAYVLDRMQAVTGLWLRSSGHAGEWGRTGREAGWTVGVVPAAQSIMVMPYANGHPYAVYAGGRHARVGVHPDHGHVAWVERLDATGNWALVTDQNWDGAGQRGARWIWLQQAPLLYIYSDR